MENPYDLFLALLAPKTYGGVTIPRNFSPAFRDALLESIAVRYGLDMDDYSDHLSITGFIDSPRLRESINTLIDPLLPYIEQQYSNGGFGMTERPVFRLTGNGLELCMCGEAKQRDEYFRAFEPEYAAIKERFPQAFAQRLNPVESSRALRMLSQESLVGAKTQSL